MSLVFAAITPHPPVLIPSIGKEAIKKIDKTILALKKLEEDLYLAKPDVLVIFSPHGTIFPDSFAINVSPEYQTDLRDFGDLSVVQRFKGEVDIAAKISHAGKQGEIPSSMITETKLDYGVAVPLHYLLVHLPTLPILPISPSQLDHKSHVEFGYLVKEQIMNSNKRVAILASGDLSRALTTDAPAGFNPAGAQYDAKIQELLMTRNTAGILQLDQAVLTGAAECGFRVFLMLMGVLRGVNYRYTSYAYEAPFGVGCLTAQFEL